jgi:hypothetical protein
MSKYDLLGAYLRKQSGDEVPMTFDGIEKITGAKLPVSAGSRAWWSNNAFNSVLTKVWLDAGFRSARVDMKKRRLVFERIRTTPRGMAEEATMYATQEGSSDKPGFHPLIGCMKGTFTIEPGWDLTRPALDPEEMAAWDASLDRKADVIAKGFSTKS